jgi:hypothetical protein
LRVVFLAQAGVQLLILAEFDSVHLLRDHDDREARLRVQEPWRYYHVV